jgi:protein-tyrosine phosphatase
VLLLQPERFAEAVEAVADAPEGAVVVHCAGGKDRTGLVTALLLRLAGVGIAEIAADYALSGANLRERALPWIEEAETEEEQRRRERISVTPAESMTGVLEELQRRYGGVAGYLRAGGASDEVLERARARLRS